MRAHYATTTPFYSHVVSALEAQYGSVTLQRRFQLEARTARRLRPFLPGRVHHLLERRVAPLTNADRVSTLKWWSFVPAAYAQFGLRMPANQYRALIRATAAEVRSGTRGVEVLQFTEGIGYLALREQRHALAVMERRHLHHSVFLTAIDTWGGFPTPAIREPIPDVLEEEYARSDAIVVYSDAARASFLRQGFDGERVFTVHRGVSPLPEVEPQERDPRLAIYVGRGDADKGLDVAVGAIEKLGTPYRLAVAGPLSKPVRDWLLGRPQVEHLGLLGRADLARLYRRATLMVLPSVESFGLAMVDAASTGLRIVCRDTAGIGPSLGSAVSRVLAGRDVDDWASALVEEFELETDDRRATRIADNPVADRFSWTRAEDAMRAVHRALATRLSP